MRNTSSRVCPNASRDSVSSRRRESNASRAQARAASAFPGSNGTANASPGHGCRQVPPSLRCAPVRHRALAGGNRSPRSPGSRRETTDPSPNQRWRTYRPHPSCRRPPRRRSRRACCRPGCLEGTRAPRDPGPVAGLFVLRLPPPDLLDAVNRRQVFLARQDRNCETNLRHLPLLGRERRKRDRHRGYVAMAATGSPGPAVERSALRMRRSAPRHRGWRGGALAYG